MKKPIIVLLLTLLSLQVFGKNDVKIIKERIAKDVLLAPYNDSLTKVAFESIQDDGSWANIDYKDLSLVGFQHVDHVNNIMNMTLSYSKKGSKYYKSKKLLKEINSALKFWCDNDFKSQNWWHNIFFLPHNFVGIAYVMEDHIPPTVLNKMMEIIARSTVTNVWARPSADRIKICGTEAKNFLLMGDEIKFRAALDVIEEEMQFWTGTRRMQNDYSFHHRIHRENNTTSYGLSYGETCIDWFTYLQGTKYELPKDRQEFIVDFYLDGVAKMSAYGKYKEYGSANRGITRPNNNPIYSPVALEKIIKLTDYRKAEIQELIDLRTGKIDRPTTSYSKYFWQSEFFAFQRPHFYTSVRMYSTRNRNTELAHNGEGIFNHYKADGANHLAITGYEYHNIWPVYDWRKIPGTTVLQKGKMQSVATLQKEGLTEFVGAATDGLYGVVGFDFISPHDNIHAKKSWFFFDNEYVCMGAGIASNDFNADVVTSINQSLLKGDVIVKDKNQKQTLKPGAYKFNNAEWVYHDKVAYIFPQPLNLEVSNKVESGRWSDINRQNSSPKELIELDVFKLYVNHGPRPQGENLWLVPGMMDTKDVTYSYIVVPDIDSKEVENDRGIKILSNTHKIQAVMNTKLGIVQVVFYQAGKVNFGQNQWISSDTPGIVMIKMNNNIIEKITASDPTRKIGKLHLELSTIGAISIEMPKGDLAGSSTIVEF